MLKFSIIVPLRKINDFMRESITHLKNLNYDNFEVIIITDDPQTYPFEDDRFKLTDSAGVGNPSLKRNIGAKFSSGDILVFMDDDAYPSPDWLVHAAKHFQDPTVYALGGPAMTPLNAPFLEKMSGAVLESKLASGGTLYRHMPQKARAVDDFPSVNLFVRRDAFFAIDGFDTAFWPGEDTKLCLDLLKHFGRKFKYSPDPVVYHHRRTLFRPHLKQVSRYGQYRGQFARVYPETSRLPTYFVPSLFVIGLFVGIPLSLWSAPLSYIYIAAISLYLMLLFAEFVSVSIKHKSMKAGLYVAVGIFLTHLTYGANFIVGFIRKPRLKFKAVDAQTGNYSEG